MNAALADYRLVWRHAVAPSTMRNVVCVICTLCVVGGAWLGYQGGGEEIGRAPVALVTLPVLMMAMLYWLELVAGAVRQDTPANAKLVPRLRLRAMQLVGAYFIVFLFVITVVLGGIFGNKALWAAVAAAWLVGAGMTRAGLQHGMALQFIPLLMLMLPRAVLQSLRDLEASPLGLMLCGVEVVLVAWYGMRSLFPTGDRHFRQRAAVEKGIQLPLGRATGGNEQAMRTARGWYASDLARAGNGRKAPGELMLHAFGPSAHWSLSVYLLLVLSLVLVAFRILLELVSEDNQYAVSVVGGYIIFPLLLVFASAPQTTVSRAFATTGEQALLRLTPAMPQIADFNREVANALLRRALIEWAILTVGLVGVTVMVDARWEITLLQFSVCCLAMPLTTVVLRDYARSQKLGSFYVCFAALGLVLAAGAAYFASLRSSPVLVSATAIVIGVAVTAVLASSRKRMMVRAPTAFPAGRLAA